MFTSRRPVRPAERRRHVAGLVIAAAAMVGLGVEIAWMVTAVPF
jgi:hypothetical protein